MKPSVSPVMSTSLERLRTLIRRSATPAAAGELRGQRLPERGLLERDDPPEAEDGVAASR